MKYNEKQWNRFLDSLEGIIFALCVIYGLALILTYIVFNGGLIPYFFNLLTMGLLFFLLGLYPFMRKRSRERLRKGKRLF